MTGGGGGTCHQHWARPVAPARPPGALVAKGGLFLAQGVGGRCELALGQLLSALRGPLGGPGLRLPHPASRPTPSSARQKIANYQI
jgi:hypothetical protein